MEEEFKIFSYEADLDQLWGFFDEKSGILARDVKIGVAFSFLKGIMKALDSNKLKVCRYSEESHSWTVNQRLVRAIWMYIALKKAHFLHLGSHHYAFDRIPSKFVGWSREHFVKSCIRIIPGAQVRFSAYLGKRVVVMPAFINMGAYVGDDTLIDSWTTIGSCAYVGQKCHISSGVTLGGILEPVWDKPVIIEDEVFVGANSSITEGVLVEKGAVIGSGVQISSTTKIYDRKSNSISYGVVPKNTVVVSGVVRDQKESDVCSTAAVIVKRVDSRTKSKTQMNRLLREK